MQNCFQAVVGAPPLCMDKGGARQGGDVLGFWLPNAQAEQKRRRRDGRCGPAKAGDPCVSHAPRRSLVVPRL